MATEQLTYDQLAERLGTTREAARAVVKRHRLPRSRTNDGKTLVAVDLDDLRHKPLPARSPRGHRGGRHTEGKGRRTGSRTDQGRRAFGWSPGGLRARARPNRPDGHRPGPPDH